MHPLSVLVVEDVPQVRATAVHMLEGMGCDVVDAYNGQEALRTLHARPDIQVMVADVRMPGLSGPELADAARRLRPKLGVILTSGYVSERDLPGDEVFVPKPRVSDIATAIERVRAWQER